MGNYSDEIPHCYLQIQLFPQNGVQFDLPNFHWLKQDSVAGPLAQITRGLGSVGVLCVFSY